MIKRREVYKINEQDQKDHELAEWAFQSHSWIETAPGYFECEWCKAFITSLTHISKDFGLCEENPCIKKLIENVKKGGII